MLKTLLTPPEEHVEPMTARQVLPFVVAVIVLLVIANAIAIWELDQRPRNRGYEVIGHKWTLASEATEPVDLLFVGDSSCNQGIMPSIIEEETGRTVLNLCTVGSATVADDAWILDYYLENVGTPEAVVVVHTWDTWARDETALSRMLWAIPIGAEAWRGREPALELRPADRVLAVVGRQVPLYTQNTSLMAAITSPGSAADIRFEDGGFMPMEEGDPELAAADVRKHRQTAAAGFEVSDWSRAGIDALIDRAAQAEIPVYLVVAPTHVELANDADVVPYFEAHRAMLDELAEADHVHVASGMPLPIHPEMLEKVDHVNVEGAAVYSRYVAQALVEAGSR